MLNLNEKVIISKGKTSVPIDEWVRKMTDIGHHAYDVTLIEVTSKF